MPRIREIIKNLDYQALKKQGLIPDLVSLFSQTPQIMVVKRYPPFVYSSKDYSGFGIFIEQIIQSGFRIHLNQPIEPQIPFSKNINDIANKIYTDNPSQFEWTSVQKYIPNLVNMIKEVTNSWNSFPQLNGTLKYHTEYNYENISAHPDLITDQAVLDIKTTSSFSSMAESTALQILSYYAICKLHNPDIIYTGVVLPMQRTVAIYDLSNWDPTDYIEFLVQESTKKFDIFKIQLQIYNHSDILSTIGSHHAKGTKLSTSLLEFIERSPNRPVQMFLKNPRTGKGNKNTIHQIPEASQLISSFNLQYFTHAPYVINLCVNEKDDDYWQQRYLNDDLIQTVALGGKGVVVHTGARKYGTVEESINTMELMIRNALVYATEECPLLLETSAGEGNDICTQIEELGSFFYRFTEAERKKLGVCVDTCHVFSTGYNPLMYLQHWETHCKIRIGLIHFNDSETQCGGCCDRHAQIGMGKIGVETLIAIADWANQRKIPMVRE